jgi:MFS family permease
MELSSGKKKFFILAILLLAAACTASSYGGSIILPTKLKAIDGMSFYAASSALSAMGMMLILPLLGVLYSKFGKKAVTITGLFLQIVTRILAIIVVDPTLFIIIWMFNGLSTGMYMPASYAIMAEVVTTQERPKYYGLIATFNALGALIGPVLVGILVDHGLSSLGFLSYIPLVIIPIIGLFMFYPNQKGKVEKFDFAGVGLLFMAISCIVVWLSMGGTAFSWVSPIGIALIAVGIISFIALIKVELSKENPAVPVGMFKKKRFTAVFLCQMLLTAYAACAAGYAIAYVQQVMQASAFASSTITLPQTIVQAIFGVIIGSFVSKNFIKRFRPMAILALVCYTVAMLIFFLLKPDTTIFVIYIATALGGIGQSVSQSSFAPYFQTELEPEEIGTAQAMYTFASTGGGTIFAALGGAILSLGFGFNGVFLLGTVFCSVSLLIVLLLFRFKPDEKLE